MILTTLPQLRKNAQYAALSWQHDAICHPIGSRSYALRLVRNLCLYLQLIILHDISLSVIVDINIMATLHVWEKRTRVKLMINDRIRSRNQRADSNDKFCRMKVEKSHGRWLYMPKKQIHCIISSKLLVIISNHTQNIYNFK